ISGLPRLLHAPSIEVSARPSCPSALSSYGNGTLSGLAINMLALLALSLCYGLHPPGNTVTRHHSTEPDLVGRLGSETGAQTRLYRRSRNAGSSRLGRFELKSSCLPSQPSI